MKNEKMKNDFKFTNGLVLTNGQFLQFFVLYSNGFLLRIMQLRTTMISTKTLLNKVQNCVWLPLMWIHFSQT